MAQELPLATSIDVWLGPLVSATDGQTMATATTVTSGFVFKRDGTTAARDGGTACVVGAEGWIRVPLTSNDTDVLGGLKVAFTGTGVMTTASFLPVWGEFVVVATDVFDARQTSTGVYLPVNTLQFETSSADLASVVSNSFATGALNDVATAAFNDVSATSVASEVWGFGARLLTSGDIIWTTATRVLTANTNFNDLGSQAVAVAVWDQLQSGHQTASTFGKFLDQEVSSAGGGTLTATSIASEVWGFASRILTSGDVIWTTATRVLTANTNLNDLSSQGVANAVWDELSDAHTTASTFGKFVDAEISSVGGFGISDVSSAVASQLQLIELDHLMATTATFSNVATGSILAQLAVNNAAGTGALFSGFDNTIHSLEAIATNTGSGASATGIASEVWGFASRILTSGDVIWGTATRVLTAGTNLNDLGSTAVAASVWDELQSGHITASTFGKFLDQEVSSAGGGTLTATSIASEVWGFATKVLTSGDVMWATATRELTANTNLNDLGSQAVSDAVWDELQSGHVTASTFGKFLDQEVSSAGGGSLTATSVASEVWGFADRILTSGDIVWSTATRALSEWSFATVVWGSTASTRALSSEGVDDIASGVWVDADAFTSGSLNDLSSEDMASAIWDEILTGATHNVQTSAGRRLRDLQDFGQYEDGAVWIDTVNGATGVIVFEDGTVNNPVNTVSGAKVIADDADLQLKRFRIVNSSDITLVESVSGYSLVGEVWSLDLSGQGVDDAFFMGAMIEGTFTGNPHLLQCAIASNGITGQNAKIGRTGIEGNITNNASGDWFLHHCWSEMAGTGTPVFDFGALASDSDLNVRAYSGGIEIQNMGGVGNDNMTLEGDGQLILNANTTSGTTALRGNFAVTNNAATGHTLLFDDDTTDINSILSGALSTGDLSSNVGLVDGAITSNVMATSVTLDADVVFIGGASGAATNLRRGGEALVLGLTCAGSDTATVFADLVESTDDHFNGRVLTFTTGALAGQSTVIIDYDGASGAMTVSGSLTENPASGVEFLIS